MPRAFASIGSNVDRERNVRSAVRRLRERFGELRLSHVYDSDPVGFDGACFYNLVAAFESDWPVERIQTALADIEQERGRVRGTERFGPRTLDLDLLLYGDLVDPARNLPRAEILRYAFVLAPLAEIAARECHPVTGETFGELWERFPDPAQRVSVTDFDPS
jgi:2-amino-4-hydroxy-6-hydroxymethyldihydropteridine diphosphokinase